MKLRLFTAVLLLAIFSTFAIAGGVGPTMPPPPGEGQGPFDCGNYPIGFVGPVPPGCYVPDPGLCGYLWVWMPWLGPFVGC